MSSMTSRERVLKAINHEEPDRVPLDLGGSHVSTIHYEAYGKLLEHLHIEQNRPPIRKVAQTVNEICEPLLEHFGIDFLCLMPGMSSSTKNKDLPDGTWQDEFGVVRQRTATSKSYDLYKSPLAGEVSLEEIDKYDWPDPHDPARTQGLKEKAKFLYENTNCAIVAALEWNIVLLAQYLRGFFDWFSDVCQNPDLCWKLHEKVTDLLIQQAGHFLDAVGDYVQIVLFADDVAGQDGIMIRPNAFRELVKPHWKKLFRFLRSRTKAKLALHSCGNVMEILDDILEMEVDILNPIQVSARDMDTKRMKREYGDKLTFWGGIDTQSVLPNGNTEQVRKEVRRRIDDLATGGGYILSAVMTILPDVPPENVCAMFDEARVYGKY